MASDAGRVLLVKNGAAVEDIWTLNDKRTIRFFQRGKSIVDVPVRRVTLMYPM